MMVGRKVLELNGLAFRKLYDRVGELGEFCYVDTKTLIADSLDHLVQQRNISTLAGFPLPIVNMCRDMQIAHIGSRLSKGCQFMEVSCKQTEALDLHCNVSIRG